MQFVSEAELKAHLMENDEGFRALCSQHQEYDQKLRALEAKAHLTGDEQLEEVRLKKLKLHAKDMMQQIVSRYRSMQQVG